MKQKVNFELLQPVMCGGVRIEKNFFESEAFIRGNVIRAAFATQILLECPFADRKSSEGKYNFIEIKDADGRCLDCRYNKICNSFGNMTFSCAYPENSIPAPFTAKKCKKCDTKHKIKDILVESGMIVCDECKANNANDIARMENLKGLICQDGEKFVSLKIPMTLSTHTAINYHSHTAADGSLFSIKAIEKGQIYTTIINDCGTDMLNIFDVIYAGKYSSCGFGKMKIIDLQPVSDFSMSDIKERIENFNIRFNKHNLASVLLITDMLPLETDISDKVLTNEEYLEYWQKSIFGTNELPFSISKIHTETQLYSGFDTSKSWGNWKQTTPDLLLKKGTSLLLEIKENCFDEAIEILTKMQNNGIGKKTQDGFGQVEICHPIHCTGVK